MVGQNFGPLPLVFVDGAACSAVSVVVASSMVTCTAPDGLPGLALVVVTAGPVHGVNALWNVTYATPIINGLSPSSAVCVDRGGCSCNGRAGDIGLYAWAPL